MSRLPHSDIPSPTSSTNTPLICFQAPSQPDTKKRLALAIHDFLGASLKDGTISSDDAESVEVAQQGIADAFHVDPTNEQAMKEALGGQNLLSI